MFALTEEIANRLMHGVCRVHNGQVVTMTDGEWKISHSAYPVVPRVINGLAVVVFTYGKKFDVHELDQCRSFIGYVCGLQDGMSVIGVLLSDIDDFGRWYLANHSAEVPWFDYILAEDGDILLNNRKEAVA